MVGERQYAPLAELGILDRGKSRHRPRYDPILYGGKFPFIQTGDVKASGGRITTYSQTYSEFGLAQSRLWEPGTLCITIAANIAETALLTFPACFPDSVVGFIADSRKVDVAYVEYALRFMRSKIQSDASGSVQDNINLEYLRKLEIPVCSLHEQKAIAHILGTLDDKIELNRKTYETLEAIAQALFKSWFADFDPVRSKVESRPIGLAADISDLFPDSFEDSELGDIPTGWRVGGIEDLLLLQRGFDLPSHSRTPGDFPVVAASGVSGTHNVAMVKAPGVVTGRSGILGNVFYVQEDFWPLNTTLWVKEFRAASPIYAYFALKEIDLSVFNAGSAVPTLNRNHLTSIRVVIPPPRVVEAYSNAASTLMAKKHSLEASTRIIVDIRDTLLPKLISGELRVPEAEAVLEAAGV